MAGPPDVTQLLVKASEGNREALNALMSLLYEELHSRAELQMRRERADHTLQATALVNEAYVRLVNQEMANWKDRSHFFALAARTMRQILVDHARARNAEKRWGRRERVPLAGDVVGDGGSRLDLVALEDSLKKLEEYDPRMSQIVEMRFFGGMTIEAIAKYLGVNPSTVKRDWKAAKIYLLDDLGGGGE